MLVICTFLEHVDGRPLECVFMANVDSATSWRMLCEGVARNIFNDEIYAPHLTTIVIKNIELIPPHGKAKDVSYEKKHAFKQHFRKTLTDLLIPSLAT